MKPVLQAREVGKKFGAVVAASNLNIDIFAGERVSLIGSNGAGKTTFVNMITGYLKPDQGQILLASGCGAVLPNSAALWRVERAGQHARGQCLP